MDKIRMRWTGIRPLLMHNGDLADPLNPTAIAIKGIVAKGSKKQTDKDHAQVQRLEWEGGLYWDDDAGPFIPNDNIERCMQIGGSKKRIGKDIQSAIYVADDIVPLLYDGPRDKEELYEDDRYRLRKGVVPQSRGRIMRTRPRFPVGWSIEFTLEFDDQIVTKTKLSEAAIDAGTYIGLGDWRPKYGRFEVVVL